MTGGLVAEVEIAAMSGWLSRAKGALSGREAELPTEPIEIACPCGRKVEAVRRPAFQRVLCKGCGEPFFLLPLDVYPRPVMKIRKVKPTQMAPPATPQTVRSAASESVAPAKPRIDLAVETAKVLAKAREQLTPLRLIVLSLLTVIALTGWWQWHRATRSQAEIDFKNATDAGFAALRKADLIEAAQHFERAADAVDILGRTDVAAEQARQRFRQVTAINSLMTRSIAELIESAKAARASGDPAAAESEFANVHAGRWLILHSELSPMDNGPSFSTDELAPENGEAVPKARAPAASSTPRGTWQQWLQIGDETLLLTATLPVFLKVPAATSVSPAPHAAAEGEQLPDTPNPNDLGHREVLFAAQVESLKWDSAASQWVLTLKSSSGFLWTDYELLLAAGVLPDELRTEAQLRSLLREQSRWIGAAE